MSDLERLSPKEFLVLFRGSSMLSSNAKVGVAKVGSVGDGSSPTFARCDPTDPTFATSRRFDLPAFDRDPRVAASVCRLLGLSPGEGERSVLEAGDDRVLVSLWHDQNNLFKLRVLDGWPSSPRRKVLALVEAFFAQTTGLLVARLPGPTMARWKLRMLVEVGQLRPAAVILPTLPPTAPSDAVETWSAIAHLLAIRRIEEPPASPIPLVAPMLSQWSGLSEARVRRGKFWLERRGALVKAGTEPSGYPGRPTQLWVVKGEHLEDEATFE